MSVEKDAVAHSTLRLRAFLRKFRDGGPLEYIDFLNGALDSDPDWSELYPEQWALACHETLNLTLGDEGTRAVLTDRIEAVRKRRGDRVILIGGPPCQAYSLAGRGRMPNHKGYVPHIENRHLLYREYIRILRDLRPVAFVMENVRGMLSARIAGESVFELVTGDLREAGYDLMPLEDVERLLQEPEPSDYVVKAERYGVPQSRHRVIITGIRRDLRSRVSDDALPLLRQAARPVTVRDAIMPMPSLRSRLSRRLGGQDSPKAWADVVHGHLSRLAGTDVELAGEEREVYDAAIINARPDGYLRTAGSTAGTTLGNACPPRLRDWLEDPRLERLTLHETRSHMEADLGRYLFAAAWAKATGVSPKAAQFPAVLAPMHGSWTKGQYADRFRVQVWDRPSSTITCHVSKDGHYVIHPDHWQCRSLTVRECARLQTFPDNYFFRGNRTQQYVQIGNAVPPFLALQIGEALLPALESALQKPTAFTAGKAHIDVPA